MGDFNYLFMNSVQSVVLAKLDLQNMYRLPSIEHNSGTVKYQRKLFYGMVPALILFQKSGSLQKKSQVYTVLKQVGCIFINIYVSRKLSGFRQKIQAIQEHLRTLSGRIPHLFLIYFDLFIID